MTLKSFPRGGKKPDSKPNNSGLLFKKRDSVATKPKKKRGKKDKDAEPEIEEKNYIAKTAESLTYSSLGEGMVVLGRIHEATEYDMIVTLPGRLCGRVQVTDVSEAYTNLLQTIVKSEDSQPSEFKSLSELYKRDEYVVCYVKSLNPTEKWKVSLSLEPELINRNLDQSRLGKGSKITGTISSVEDHGYVVDTGIDNLRTFLAIKDIDENVTYYPGKQIFCAVKKVKTTENSTTAQLSTKSKHVSTALTEDSQSLDALVPGTKFTLSIQNVLSNGLQVSFNNGNVGYINRIYLDKPLTSYGRGREIQGTLMYVMPTVKFAYFTLLPADEEAERLNVGDTFENAKVLYTGSSGVVMSLKKGIRGLVPFRRTDVAYEKISGVFTPESIHKCRVLAYDSFERIYVCTMERELLEQKHLASAPLTPGETLEVKIARIQPETGYVMVTAGRTKGWVAPEHIRDIDQPKKEAIKIGDVVKARVLGRDKKQTGILFTLKKSLIESDLPVLRDISQAKVGSKHHGTIVQINGKGLLVRFYDRLKGWVPSRSLQNKDASAKWNFIVGQTIVTKIEQVERHTSKITLSVYTETKIENIDYEIGQTVEGVVIETSVEGVHLSVAADGTPRTAFLPAGLIAPCPEIASNLSARYVHGGTITALVFATSPRFIVSRTFVPEEKHRDFNNLNIGEVIPCAIHEFTKNNLKVILPVKNFDSYGIVPLNKVDNVNALYPYQLLFAKIHSIDKKHKKITLSTELHEVWNVLSKEDTDLIASIDVTSLYMTKLAELSELYATSNKIPITEATLGGRVNGVVDKVTDHGLVLKLENNLIGTVRKSHYKDNVKVGDKVNGTILWINYIHELVEVTLLPSFMNIISTKQNKLFEASVDTQLRGDIVLITNWFALVVLRGAGKGNFAALPTRRHINDTEPDLSPYSIGTKIRCYVVLNGSQSGMMPICLLKSSFEIKKNAEIQVEIPIKKSLKRKSESSINIDHSSTKVKKTQQVSGIPEVEKSAKQKKNKKKKAKKEVAKTEAASEALTLVENQTEISKQNKFKRKIDELEIEEPDVTIDSSVESDDDSSELNKGDAKERLAIPECGFFWDNKPDESLRPPEESSSDEDEEEEIEPKQKKKKKLSAAERRELERQKEREIREREEALASNQAPNSVDQFDRLVLSSPDNSMIWLQYMAYHLQATEIEKARAVAKRAIKTINFREESERLNVWQAWLNLESRFGTSESLESVFQDAVKTNDASKVYIHMLNVHADAGRQSELEKIVTTITGKFKQDPKVWVECGSALLKMGLKDKSRHIMQRALQSLSPQEHVNLMVKFAQMENKFGDKERAQTLFEQILSSYPKRVDVWSTYVDALVKSEDFDVARKVLERAVVQTLPARKMKTLFKKFISFEEAHGTPEGVSHVQHLALKYVENQCSKDSA